MQKKNKILKNFEKNGYVVIKNFLKSDDKQKLKKIADDFSYRLINKWNEKIKYQNNIYKRIIDHYLTFKKPEYRRNPNKNLATKIFFKFVNSESFKILRDVFNKKRWFFSYYKNIRFKSKVLPWVLEPWHCDRYTYKSDFYKKNFQFLIVWIPLQKMNKNCEGGLEIIKRNKFFSQKVFANQRLDDPIKLFNCSDRIKKVEHLSVKPRLNFGDILVMSSDTVHKTIKTQSRNPFWSLDMRFEFGNVISQETKKMGFNFDESYRKNLKIFLNSKNFN